MVTHDTLMEFCKGKSHFTKKDFLNYISGLEYDELNVDELFELSPYLFSNKGEELYTTRASVFNGSIFKIVLTSEEIKKKILYVGHRFVPFYPSEMFPSELTISKNGNEKVLKTKTVVRNVNNLYDFYKFLGAENIIDSLLAEDSSNVDILRGENNSVKVSVFDLKPLPDDSFVNGNELYFKVSDWDNGMLTIVTNHSSVCEEVQDSLLEDFENALRNVFIDKGPTIDIPEQLALAYYELTLQKNVKPVFDILEFVSSAKDTKLTYYEDNSILWFANDDSLTKEYQPENNSISVSDTDSSSIDEIFYQLKIPLSKVELEAFFKDSLMKNEEKSPFQIIESFLNKKLIVFKDEFQATLYKNFVEELWEVVKDGFLADETDELKELRTEILASLRKFYLTEKVQKIDVYDSPLITLRDMLQHINMCRSEKLTCDDVSFIFKISHDAIAELGKI